MFCFTNCTWHTYQSLSGVTWRSVEVTIFSFLTGTSCSRQTSVSKSKIVGFYLNDAPPCGCSHHTFLTLNISRSVECISKVFVWPVRAHGNTSHCTKDKWQANCKNCLLLTAYSAGWLLISRQLFCPASITREDLTCEDGKDKLLGKLDLAHAKASYWP